ncbi:MAG: dihydropteroate synthase [Crocinitomicaceae bacterium]|nr:dihydropteroate synthase [Crocinitomicaceae bacterium]
MQNSKVEDTKFQRNTSIRVRDILFDLSTPKVMGIVNVTPDSFYSESRAAQANLLFIVEKMLNEGMQIVDIGGYSSRPGSTEITVKEELNRVIPAISAIRKAFPDLIISLDTFRSEVAEKGILTGADIINDISGFSIEPQLIDVVSKYKVPYILMHMRGTPETMNSLTNYDSIFNDMILYFSEKIEVLKQAGVNDIIIDPGFGFSKTIDQNYYLLDHLDDFLLLGKPVLAGLSRKSMIYKRLNTTPEDEATLDGTIALNKIALQKGATILRVHDVKEAVDLIK